MRRREFLLAIGGAAAASPRRALAQQPAPKMPRVGIVSPAQSEDTPIFQAFRKGLREHGYVEGRNIVLEFRLADGDYDALPRLVSELVNLPVDVIPANAGTETNLRATEEAARTGGIAITTRIEAMSPASLHALRPDQLTGPLLVLPDAMLWNERRVILTWAAAARAPGVFPEREYADDGGLIGYGPNVPANFHRAAAYVDRILKERKLAICPSSSPRSLISSSISRRHAAWEFHCPTISSPALMR